MSDKKPYPYTEESPTGEVTRVHVNNVEHYDFWVEESREQGPLVHIDDAILQGGLYFTPAQLRALVEACEKAIAKAEKG